MSLKVGKDRPAFRGQFLKVIEREFWNTRTGKGGKWEVVQRYSKLPIAVIAAVTPDRKLVLTKTFRVPLKAWMIEMCAGLIEKSDKNPATAARRELLEELGYTVGQVDQIIIGPHNAGMQSDHLVIFLGWDAKKVQEPQLETGEDIQAIEVPIDGLMEWLECQQKKMSVDVKIFGLIPFLQRGPKPAKRGPKIKYKRKILHRDQEMEIVRIDWPVGSKSRPHDHGDSRGCTIVLKGSVFEKTFDRKDKMFLRDNIHPANISEIFEESPRYIHIIGNANPDIEAVTLHVYMPPLKMNFYDELS